jgi:hypothetical protein
MLFERATPDEGFAFSEGTPVRRRCMVALASAFLAPLACGGTTRSDDSGIDAGGGTGGEQASSGGAGASGGTTGEGGSGTAGRATGGAIGAGGKAGAGGRTPTGGRAGTGGDAGATLWDAGTDGSLDGGNVPEDAPCMDYSSAYALSWGPDGGLVA